jgi:hypothetical protein
MTLGIFGLLVALRLRSKAVIVNLANCIAIEQRRYRLQAGALSFDKQLPYNETLDAR